MAEREQTPSAGAPADTSADPTTTPPAPEQAEAERVARVLTDEIERIDSPEAADEVVRELEALAGDATTGERAASAAEAPETASEAVRAAAQAPGPVGTAAALTEAAAQIVAPTPESPAVAKAAADVLPPRDVEASPRTERGRRLLRDAMLRRMKPIQAIDTRLFLAVNCLSHPPASDAIADTITIVTTGGWVWLIGLGAAQAFGVRKSGHALRLAIPSVIIATWFVENPIKALFRRRRPFIDIVRTLVVGRRPDGWSFPSGHSAAAFSGAWILSTVWPRATPIFFALASLVGFSRVYVGAHYPSDVLTGATLGTVVAEAIRRPVARYLRSR